MRYDYAARLSSGERLRALVAQHAPATTDQPAEPALIQTLSNAEDLGWQAEQLLTAALAAGPLSGAHDPAAVLQWRISQTMDRHDPPGSVVESAVPWMPVLRHSEPELANYLAELNSAISNRVTELRRQVAANPPPWTVALGPRPMEPATAAQWDYIAGLAAAYRETYNITTNDSATPIGPQPESAGAKARSWQHIISQWRRPMSSSDDSLRSENQRRIDALRDQESGQSTAGAAVGQDYAYREVSPETESTHLDGHLRPYARYGSDGQVLQGALHHGSNRAGSGA